MNLTGFIFKCFYSLLLVISFSSMLTAAEQGQAGTEIEFLSAGIGTRALSMGGAFSAVCDDVNAHYYNPAGIARLKQCEFTSMQTKLMQTVDYYYMAMGVPMENSGFTLAWLQAAVTNIPLVATTSVGLTSDIIPEGTSDYYANALIAGYGCKLDDNFALGFSLTGFYKDMAGIALGKGYGITSTLGLLYKQDNSLSYGFVLKDILNYQRWKTIATETVSPVMRLGVKWQPVPFLLTAVDCEQQLAPGHYPIWHLGSEVNLYDRIKLRTGLDGGIFTAGLSADLSVIYFDYGYLGQNQYNLGSAHRVTVGLKI